MARPGQTGPPRCHFVTNRRIKDYDLKPSQNSFFQPAIIRLAALPLAQRELFAPDSGLEP
jgi:hypothetical protein